MGRETVTDPLGRADREPIMPPKSPKKARTTNGKDPAAVSAPAAAIPNGPLPKLKSKPYEKELRRRQIELVKLQEWVKREGLRVLVLFEGPDAAGKGGVIKRISESLNPRVCRVVALGTPTERERGQWYFQRYVAHLPSRGEIVLFDRR